MDCTIARLPNRVTAVFQGAALSFDMAPETTLAQLAEQLGILGDIHGGLPLSIDVRSPPKAHIKALRPLEPDPNGSREIRVLHTTIRHSRVRAREKISNRHSGARAQPASPETRNTGPQELRTGRCS